MSASSVRHYCGLFGVFGDKDAVELTRLGLYALQHRGQESAGICSTDGTEILRHAGLGLAGDVFDEAVVQRLRNDVAIGHVRYSTTGSCTDVNSQPLLFEFRGGRVAIAHNGNLVNAAKLRHRHEEHGHIFQTTCDTEVIIHLLAEPSGPKCDNGLARVLNRLEGAFSLLLLYPDRMVAARDPYGFRPLCIGRLASGGYVVASETCALDIIDALYIRDVSPGEMVTINRDGVSSHQYAKPPGGRCAQCIFEQVYFADPSSDVFGENVHLARVAMGRALARETPSDGDMVFPVPNCARCAAIGYHVESGVPLGRGFTTSHYVGRSFIQPTQRLRDLAVKVKLNVIRKAVEGKRVIVVEDSVVRGTTTWAKMGALRRAGAKEIHLRVASPPIRYPCYFGIDFPNPEELIAVDRTVEQIRDYLEVDSLHYLSLEAMLDSVNGTGDSHCTACFSGRYPFEVTEPVDKFAVERHQVRML